MAGSETAVPLFGFLGEHPAAKPSFVCLDLVALHT